MRKSFIFILLLFALSNFSCSVYQTLVNISRLQFKLGNVNGFTVSGIPVAGKTRISDFSALDVVKLTASFAQHKLPVSFILNVQAQNPNDGTGGYQRTGANLESFPWRLTINDKETIGGNIASKVFVPGTGETTTFPLQINVDLYQFFKEKGYEDLLNLVLNIGGGGGSAQNLAVYAKPTVSTSLGNITYPQEIKIVSYQFTK